MLNVVEDAPIEGRAMERWPGVRANLAAIAAGERLLAEAEAPLSACEAS